MKKLYYSPVREKAIKESLEHWERNEWKRWAWSEGRSANNCALCGMYRATADGIVCGDCPIVLHGHKRCDSPRSAWMATWNGDKAPIIKLLRKVLKQEQALPRKRVKSDG